MKIKSSSAFVGVGVALLIASVLLAGYNIYDDMRAQKEVASVLNDMRGEYSKILSLSERYNGEIPDYILNPKMEMPTKEIDGYDYIGMVAIPDYSLELPVMSDWSYPALKIAPCRFQGSAYTNDLIIAAHSYKSHFRDIQNIEMDTDVIFSDIDGNVFKYKVCEREVVASNDLNRMESGDWDLTLFTCTPGGRSRVAVRCERQDEDELLYQFRREIDYITRKIAILLS